MPFLGKTPTKFLDANVNIDGGNIDGTTIGATSAASATVTTFTSTGIDDNATSTAITIDSSANVGIGTTSPGQLLEVSNTAGNASVEVTAVSTGSSALRFSDNLGANRGIVFYEHSSDSMQLYTANTEAMRINSSGNVGIGTTNPVAHLTINAGGSPAATYGIASFAGGTGVDSYVTVSRGSNDQGGIKVLRGSVADLSIYVSGAESSIINYNGGDTNDGLFFQAGSAATNVMALDSSGNVGIGTASPNEKLNVSGNIRVTSGFVSFSGSISTPSEAAAVYRPADNTLAFSTANSERARINSSGDLLVGTTNQLTSSELSAGETGIALRSASLLTVSRDGGAGVLINRKTSDGDLIEFRKDGTTVGSISNNSSNLQINGIGALELQENGTTRAYVENTGFHPWSNNTYDLGTSSARWKDLYLSGGAYLGGTGAANHLDDYEEGTWTPIFTGNTTNPTVTYDRNDGFYVKIGRKVFARIEMRTDSVSGGSGTLRVSGLPFTAVTGNGARAGGLSVHYTSGWGTKVPQSGYVNNGETEVVLGDFDSASAEGAERDITVEVSDLNTTANKNYLMAEIIYETS